MKRRVRLAEFLISCGRLARIAWIYLLLLGGLRALWLFRPDPFGHAVLLQPERHLLQALACDAVQAAVLAVPSLLLAALAGGRPRVARAASWLYLGLLALAIFCSILDEETVRFAGVHLSLAHIRTYGNGAAVSEMPKTLAYDEGGPFLGLLLVISSLPLSWWLMRNALRRRATPRTALFAGGFIVAAAASYVYLFVMPPPSVVRWRLATPVDLVEAGVIDLMKPPLEEKDVARALDAAHARWARAAAAPSVRFPSARYPLLHVSAHRECQLHAAGFGDFAVGLDCDADADGDGVPLRRDCDDQRADIHPGAADLPGDGIDEDCSGADAQPWNVLLIVLESHRAVNVGHLRADGEGSTPVLDRLAAEGTTFTRAVCNGLPTIASFMTIQTGLLPHPEVYVATTPLGHPPRSLPETLREHGYYTRFFTAADPGWDNQTPWLDKWYDGWEFDRRRQTDRLLFERMKSWFRTDLGRAAGGKPFFVMAMTRTNHVPFERIAGVPRTGGDTLDARIRDTMRYTDAALGDLLDGVRDERWFAHTIVIVTGDHGFPLGEHGTSRLGETAHVEATGVPLVFSGGHPKLAALRGRRDEPASHIDIAPTVLDLIGIDGSGAWMGRSLVAGDPAAAEALTLAPMLEWAAERDLRVLVAPARWPAADAVTSFDRRVDRLEARPLSVGSPARDLATELTDTARLMKYLYETDRIWPRWWTDGPVSGTLAGLQPRSL
jgi:Sulfatase/Putative metal-binding motif